MKNNHVLRAVVGIIILANIIYLGLSYQSDTVPGSVHTSLSQAYDLSEYPVVVDQYNPSESYGGEELTMMVVSLMKLGNYAAARRSIQASSDYEPVVKNIYKLLLLMEKEDRQGVVDLAGRYSDESDSIRSLYLQIRAEAFIELGQWYDGVILARDSIQLDPFAPAGLVIEAKNARLEEAYTQAHELYERVDRLGYTLDTADVYERGVVAFYAYDIEAMERDLGGLLADEEHSYGAHIFLGRNAVRQEDYALAKDYFEDAKKIDQEKREADFWLGRVYSFWGEYEQALDYYSLAHNEYPRQMEIITDMVRAYDALGNIDKVDELLALAGQLRTASPWAATVLLRTLSEIDRGAQAWDYVPDVQTLADGQEDAADQRMLYNQISATIIYRLVDARQQGYPGVLWLNRLMGYEDGDLRDRDIFMTLALALQDDEVGALRALQVVDPSASAADIDLLVTLHHLLMGDSDRAYERVGFYERGDDDIETLRLLRYIGESSSLIDASEMKSITDQLLDLASVSGADEADMEQAFAQYMRKRWRSLAPYYE